MTYTEAHRHACEVRYVAALPSDEARAAYLAGVRESRGTDAYQMLRRDVWKVLRSERAAT